MRLTRIALAALTSIGSLTTATAASAQESPLRGTWTLVAADQIRPDGEQVRDYGESPKGRLIVSTLRFEGSLGLAGSTQPLGIARNVAASHLLRCWVRYLHS